MRVLVMMTAMIALVGGACGGDDGGDADNRQVASLADQELKDLCDTFRDAVCALPSEASSTPCTTCDPCMEADIVSRIKTICVAPITVNDVTTCSQNLDDNAATEDAFCPGDGDCMVSAINLACEP